MLLRILGPTEVMADEQPVDIRRAKQRQLLAWLAYHLDQPLAAESVAEQLWPGRPWHQVRSALHQTVSRTRRLLEQLGQPRTLVTDARTHTYRLVLQPHDVDYHHVLALTHRAQQMVTHGRVEEAMAADSEALRLWRGEPLADLASDAAEHLRSHLIATVWLPTCRRLIANQIDVGAHHAALARLEPLLARYDLDQGFATQWMAALIGAARPGDACAYFLRLQRRLQAEHEEPAADVVRLYRIARDHRSLHVTGPPETRPARADTPSPPHQLPRDLHDFIGQQSPIAAMDALLDHAHLIVVTGMPGVGKTTLATHCAHRYSNRFPDGQLYLDARGYGPTSPLDPYDGLGRILNTLGAPARHMPNTVEDRHDLLNEMLADRHVLLLIDNVRDADQLRPLITNAPQCLTIATSRAQLPALAVFHDAHSITVPPLSTDDRVELLHHILGPDRCGQNPPAIQALADLSDGLPLAVRVVAEHVRNQPRAELSDLVDDLRDHLTIADDADAILHTVFSWSYNVLDAEVAHLFRRLALFPGTTISSHAAAALIEATPREAHRLLNTLARMHLVDHDQARYYRFHDLIQQFAAHRLHADESVDVQQQARCRLYRWYMAVAGKAATILAPTRPPVPGLPTTADPPHEFTDDTKALAWCQAERDNITALTRDAAEHDSIETGWMLPAAVHEIYEHYGPQDDVLQCQEVALGCARRTGSDEAVIGTLNNLGTTCFAVHDYARGAAHFEEGLRLAQASGSLLGQAACSHNLARFRMELGDFDTAIQLYTTALHLCERLGNPAGQAFAAHRLGEAHRRIGRYGLAIQWFHQALRIREAIGSLRGQGATHAELARVRLDLDQPELALAHCRRALEFHRRAHDQSATCRAWITLATTHQRLGATADAQNAARTALQLATQLDDPEVLHEARRIVLAFHLARELPGSSAVQSTSQVSL